MKIKSARYFREKYMTDVRHVQPNAGYDTSFIGSEHQVSENTYVKGFFDLYHGDKQNVGDFLSSFLKIAEDGQAIYEFLQNAADCNSTLFYMFYNEKYFLAINNGEAFNQKGLRSILNVAQSTKSDSSQIGRFGIGFKLVHRLVGERDGMSELTNDYKGPVMFSWSKKSDLISLMNCENVESENNINDDSNLPYLLKLIVTNFPTEPNEVVRDLNYEEKVLFDNEEYTELCEYVDKCLRAYLDVDNLNQGSLFFIKLGEGKKNLLDKDYEQNFKTGVEYSLNTLKGLENVKINGTQIEKVPLTISNSVIEKGTETFIRINPEYKDDDIHFSIGYNEIDFTAENPFVKVEALKKSPTFYKYFPLGDEVHQSAIFIHCDSLSNEANRRKLHDDPTNRTLMPEIAKYIVNELSENKKENNVSRFCQLYANLLLSDAPHDNSNWLKEAYYDIIQRYLISCIPTTEGFATNVNNVKIKRISTQIPLSVVNDELQWFKWNDENHATLLDAAKEKLGIKLYDIVDLILDSDPTKLEKWISIIDDATYKSFLHELNSTKKLIATNIRLKEKIRKIKLFKFTDGIFHSYDELMNSDRWVTKKTLFQTNKTEDIKDELLTLGFVLSNINIDNYSKIKECFDLPIDKKVFEVLESSLADVELSKLGKKKLILHLTTQDSEKKWINVGEERIRSLRISHNNSGLLMPLCELIGRKYEIPSWLSNYQIKAEDYFEELDKFLMPEKEIYSRIIYENWDAIDVGIDIATFYADVQRLYNIDAEHNKGLDGKKYVYTEKCEFVSLNEIIYNSKMLDEELDYKALNNVVTMVFDASLPNKKLVKVLESAPFGLKNVNLCDRTPSGNIGVSWEDIRNILKFTTINNETFFKKFVVTQNNNEYFIDNRNNDHYQVYTKDHETKSFIDKHHHGVMILLPPLLEEYKNSEGIISHDLLYSSILKCIADIDSHKEELIDILKGNVRKDFLLGLSEIKINLDESITNNSFCVKLLDLACKVLSNTNDIKNCRNKLLIVKNGEEICYDKIPSTIAESFEVDGAKKKFDLAKILPNEIGTGALLIEIAEKLSTLGLNRDKLNELLGISENVDIDWVYETLIEHYKVLQNEQQLAFVLSFCANKNISVPQFKLLALDNDSYDGEFNVSAHDFISETYCLSPIYANLKDYINLPFGDYIEAPYISNDGKFICPGLNTKIDDKIDFPKVVSLLTYIKGLGDKVQNVDWSTIQGDLGFNPNECVYPSKYATEQEKLPTDIESWINNSSDHISLIKNLGVLAGDSEVMQFRRYMVGDLNEFDCDILYKVENKDDLENSLLWLSDKNIFPLNKDKYETLKVVVDRINKLTNSEVLKLTDKFDIEEIDENSLEYSGQGYDDWKNETGYSIYLYDGTLPHLVEMNKYIDVPIYSHTEGDVTDNGDNIIYINKNVDDLQATLHHLAEKNGINLTNEDVYKLFNRSIIDLQHEIERLKEENQRLSKCLPTFPDEAEMAGKDTNGEVDKNERPEWNELARKKVKKRLEEDGYMFTQGIGTNSVITGVLDPNGDLVPLVVKSCSWGKLYINPIEWGTLLKPNAMLWIYDGSKTFPMHLRALIREQDQLVLTMDTRNLDKVSRVSKFAEILRYFKQVHFDFNSVRPTSIASTYEDYAFDDRPMDEKPDEDEFE